MSIATDFICVTRVLPATLASPHWQFLEMIQIDAPTDINGSMSHMNDLQAMVCDRFHRQFGRLPTIVAAGPGRVNLIGEHVDYNDGFVLPMAIDRHVVVAMDDAGRRVQGDAVARAMSRVMSADRPELALFDCSKPMVKGEPAWSNYVRGVVAGFQHRGTVVPAFDAMVAADLPMGGGLSSSAALEVSTATALEALTHTTLTLHEKALLCQQAEHTFAGVPCGIMDQFASTMGRQDHLLLLDCRSQTVKHVALNDPSISVLIVNSNVKHELTDGGYALRRKQCEEAAAALGVSSLRDATMAMLDAARQRMNEVVYRRARHVISEIARTPAAARAIEAGNWPEVGRLMYESHTSLRDNFEVSCDELDVLVEIARTINSGEIDQSLKGSVIGCRMTGGGFGGCVVSLVRSEHSSSIAKTMAQHYEYTTGIAASWFTTRPAAGARLLLKP